MSTPPELIEFIRDHPEKAILMLHYQHKKQSGQGMSGTGFTFKKLIKGLKKIGNNKITKTAYKGAKYFYDYTNGLPFTAAEKLAKKAFKTDLRKFKTYSDAKKAYGYMMMDPRKYEDIIKLVASPKKTAQKVAKGAATYGPGAIIGGITGGPAGAARSTAGQKLTEDLWQDYSTLYPEDEEVPAIAKRKKKMMAKPTPQLSKPNTEGTGLNFKKALKKTGRIAQKVNPVWWGVEGFMKNNPEVAKKIVQITNKIKGQGLGLAGSGLSKTAKKILTAAGVLGTAGALGFAGYLMNKPGPVSYPQLEHNIHFDLEDWDPTPIEEEWVAGDGLSDMIKFVKKHKNKALAILLGTAAIGAAAAGEAAFRNKFAGTASTSSDGRAIIKHLLSGSEKKLETDRLIMHGPNIVSTTGSGLKTAGSGLKRAGDGLGLAGGKMSKTMKNILVAAGVASVPAAILLAKAALKNPDMDIDDFGDISAEEHYNLYGEGMGTNLAQFISKHRDIARKIINQAKSEIKRKVKGTGYSKGSGLKLAGSGRKIGTKREVWNGTALKTSGGLRKEDLIKNKRGKIVSKKQHESGLKKIGNLKPISKKTNDELFPPLV